MTALSGAGDERVPVRFSTPESWFMISTVVVGYAASIGQEDVMLFREGIK
jgi:hypothetical protein